MGVYTYTLAGLTLTITAEVYFGDIIMAGALLIALAIVTLILIRQMLNKLVKALWKLGHRKQRSSSALPLEQ